MMVQRSGKGQGEAVKGPASGDGGREFAGRVALFYAALFVIYGVHLPFLPVWLDWRGLSPSEIAAITSAPFFLRLAVTPAAALVADRSDSHRGIVVMSSWACIAFAILMGLADGFWPIFVTAVAFHIASSTIMPLTETLAVRGVKAANLDYGRMRLWGSLSFIAIGMIGGALMDRFGPPAVVWLLILGSAATAWAAHLLPRPVPRSGEAGSTPTRRSLIGADAARLVRTPLFIVFLLAAGLVQAAHATFYTFGALHWKSQGISTLWIGVLWAIGVLAEVLLFAYSRVLVERFGPVKLIVSGCAAAIVRWLAMMADPPLTMLAPLQLLHALTYGATHIGAMHFLGRAVPESAAGTAQALYATMATGVLMGGVTLASGPLYAAFGGGLYALPAVLGAISLVLCLRLQSRWQGGPLWAA